MRRTALLKSGRLTPLSAIPLESVDGSEFDEEVGGDEIRWWVFKKETDLDALQRRVEGALAAAQVLKEHALQLRKVSPDSYDKLIEVLKVFADEHRKEISVLHNFVVWLYKRSVLAPNVLFSYRVWGSTRLSELRSPITSDTISKESPRTIRTLTEIVFGLRRFKTYTLESLCREASSQAAEGGSEDREPIILSNQVLLQTSYETLGRLAAYFEFIRQSLRNILLEIDHYRAEKVLLSNEAFWRRFIRKAMRDSRTEPQLWDFKETFEMWRARGPAKDEAEVKFCEQVAGWANTSGGVFIVGITDAPRKVKGVDDLENRLKYTRGVIRKRIAYRGDFVHFQQVILLDASRVEKTCLVIPVAQTKDVVSVKVEKGRFSYPVRVETGLDFESYEAIKTAKYSVHKDNFDFVRELERFVRGK
jgi:hypothetical protein